MRRVALLAAVAVLVLAGCAQPAAEPTAAPERTDAASATAAPSSAPTPEPSSDAIDTSDWLEFRTADDDASFRYPSDWTLDAEAEPFAPDSGHDDVDATDGRMMDAATLTAPNGQELLGLYDIVDVGAACDTAFPFVVLAEEPSSVDGTTIATVAIGTEAERWIMGIGMVDDERLLQDETCYVYFTTGTSAGGIAFGTHFQMWSSDDDPLWSIDSLDDARAYMETDEYRTIIEILRSFEVR